MFGTTTLAEIKRKLIDRFGYLPDFSQKASTRRRKKADTTSELNEVEKELEEKLAELERDVERLRKLKPLT
jgi:transcription-repair coupling factor (superfamily II helicase)